MRKVSILLLVFFVFLGFFACNEKNKVKNEDNQGVVENVTAELKGIDAILPASSIAVMKVKDLEPFYKEIIPALGLDKKDMTKAIEKIGFNPLKLDELNEFGIDHSREFGLVLNSFDLVDLTLKAPPVFDMSIFIPIIEGKGIISKIEVLMQKKKKELKLIEKDGYFMVPNEKKQPNVAFKIYKDYLFVSIYMDTDPKKTYDLLGKEPIANLPLYKKLSAKINNNSCFTFFANFENTDVIDKFIKGFKNRAEKRGIMQGTFGLDFYQGYKGFIMTADTQHSDFTVDAYGVLAEDAPVLSLYKDVKYCKNSVLGIKENPLLYFSFGVNPGNYYDLIKKSFTQKQIDKFNKGVEEFKTKSGIDLHDLINNLGGNLNYAMYDGKGINIASYNTVFSLSLNDEVKGKALISKIIEMIKAEAKGKMTLSKATILNVDTTIISVPPAQFYLGVKNGAFILSTNKSYYEQALIGKTESGFTANMDKALAEKFINSDVFYLSLDEGLKVFENFKPFVMMGLGKKAQKDENGKTIIDKITKITNKFQYLMSSSVWGKDGIFKMNFIIKTRFEKSFTSGIIDIVKSFQKEEVLQ